MKKLMLLMAAVSVSFASCIYAMEEPQPLCKLASAGIVGEHETAISKNWKVWYMNKEVELTPIEFPIKEPKYVVFKSNELLLVDDAKHELHKLYSLDKILQTWLHGKEVMLLTDQTVQLYPPTFGAIGSVGYVSDDIDKNTEQRIRVLMPGIENIGLIDQAPLPAKAIFNVLNSLIEWASGDYTAERFNPNYEVTKAIIYDDIGEFQKLDSQSNVPWADGESLKEPNPYICLVASAGAIKIFKYLLVKYKVPDWGKLEYLDKFALFGGNCEIIRLCEPKDIFTPTKCAQLLPEVVSVVEPQMVDYLVKRMAECEFDTKKQALKGALKAAARHGNAVSMIYLLSKAKELIVGDGKNSGRLVEWKNIINSMFEQAVENNYIDAVKYLQEVYNADVDARDADGRTLLQLAARRNCLPVVRRLYEACHANVEVQDRYGMTSLHYAAQQGRLDIVQYLYEVCHANIETKDNAGRTPIIAAVEFGRSDVVQYLYETCNAELEWRDKEGRTPLHLAVAWGKLNMVQYLVETCGADVNAKDNDGMIPLLLAVQNNNLKIANYLYESCYLREEPWGLCTDEGRYFDIVKCLMKECQVKNEDGATLLLCAAEKGYLEVVKYLYETWHANVKAKDNECRTPMIYAVHEGYLDVVQYLYEVCHADVDVKDKIGGTPLYYAAEGRHLDVVRYLVEVCGVTISSSDVAISRYEINDYLKSKFEEQKIKSQAEIDEALEKFLDSGNFDDLNLTLQRIKDLEGKIRYNAVNKALSKAIESNNLDVVKRLCKICCAEGALGESFKAVDSKRVINEALMVAVKNDCREIVNYLCGECDADVNTQDKNSRTLISFAAENGDLELVKYLYGKCPDNIEVKDRGYHVMDKPEKGFLNEKCTPLLYAIKKDNLEIVKYLCDTCHANVNASDKDGRTPLIIAAENGDLELVKYLCETCHANVNVSGKDERTPLIIAVENDNLELVKYLGETCHANVSVRDKDRRTPLIIAAAQGNLDVVKCLWETYVDNKMDQGKNRDIQLSIDHAQEYLCEARSANAQNQDGRIQLIIAAAQRNLEVVKHLREVFDVNAQNKDVRIPLIIAAAQGNLEVVKPLCEIFGVKFNCQDKSERIPLIIADVQRNLKVLKSLLWIDAKAFDRDERLSPIIYAAKENLEVVDCLWSICRYNVEAKDNNGSTPLFSAIKNGNLNIVKYLVEACHADIEVKDKKGQTALFFAIENCKPEIARYLNEVRQKK